MGNLTDCTIYDGDEILSSVHYEYNAAGKVTAMYEGMTEEYYDGMPEDMYNLTTYTYDYWGNPYTVTYADGRVETYLYNAYDQLVQSYSSNDSVYYSHIYTYDMLGRTELHYFIGQAYEEYEHRYTYDKNDNVLEIVEWRINAPDFTYDENGDIIYDEYGIPVFEYTDYYVDSVEYTYDTLNRVATEKSFTGEDNAKTVIKTYSYDDFGNKSRDTITLDGTQIYDKTSTYDEFLRLKSVAQGGKTTAYTYDDNGNLATETTGNVVTTYGYNDANMVLTMGTKNDNVDVTSFVYNYYTDGNQRAKIDNVNNVTTAYTYDGAGQLKSEVKTGNTVSTDLYWYDASGNRTLKNEYRPDAEGNLTSKFITSTYNDMNQLVESVDSEGEEKYYYYDTWGNLISDGIAQYYYDHLNRLKEYRPFGVSNGTHYTYYIDNLRKSKDDTYFIWLDGNMVYEFTDDDSSNYTYGIHLVASDDYTYVLNAHGDVVALISTTDEVVKRYEYDSYGNEINIAPTDTNPFRYCGEYYDRETGQIYLRARYYQPIIGRFTQRDTHWNTANMIYGDEVKTKEYKDYLGLNDYSVKLVDYAAIRQSGNLYGYCLNNPIYHFDPSGEIALVDDAVILVVFTIGTIAITTYAWLTSPEGQVALAEGATFFYEGLQMTSDISQATITQFVDDFADNQTDNIDFAEHTKNKRPSNWDKHSKKRSGAPEKKDKKSNWNDRSNKTSNKNNKPSNSSTNNRNKGRK